MSIEKAGTALVKAAGNKVAEKVANSANPLSGFTEVVSAWKDFKKTQEQQKTIRTQIMANRDIAVTSIKEQAQLIRFALEKQFGERASNFSELFKRLDEGFERGDDKMIDSMLAGIVELSKISPLAQAVQAVHQQLKDPNVDCVEI